ncbi:hypothetical protein B0T26DRAFT_745077 [Lasiosphaeria miniovina]|uniref:Cytochrome c oxidase subunit 9, mitochondrial n=1 Tax=Lasiosphaeria miniovina TaxID=1954250 RepID=A0AA40EC88_9PEZI|nr:uncharacterized protein B0T26DRAFT_745077 [Lasiosphaeria miniovina]KAK0732982.1 hypothetical protein B0T26DRAFT_745077 [Lasiosphaeria miniovina]
MAIKPITGMLRNRLIVNLSVALGVGVVFGELFWRGYHLPRTVARDNYYKALEEKRAERAGV